jgi:hypothetical protein
VPAEVKARNFKPIHQPCDEEKDLALQKKLPTEERHKRGYLTGRDGYGYEFVQTGKPEES